MNIQVNGGENPSLYLVAETPHERQQLASLEHAIRASGRPLRWEASAMDKDGVLNVLLVSEEQKQ